MIPAVRSGKAFPSPSTTLTPTVRVEIVNGTGSCGERGTVTSVGPLSAHESGGNNSPTVTIAKRFHVLGRP
jgi:hypothetical protein